MSDEAKIIEGALDLADKLIRRILEERGIEVPHLVVAVTADREVIASKQCQPREQIRSIGEDLIKVADQWESSETTHGSEVGFSGIRGPLVLERRSYMSQPP